MMAWLVVASRSVVFVAHIDWTTMGLPPPMVTLPARTGRVFARFMRQVYQSARLSVVSEAAARRRISWRPSR
jgi:hypothetical protein